LKELKFYNKDRDGNRKICGSMTIKNQTDSSADLFFYGDIVSETWQSECYEEDMAPGDVKEFLDQLDGTENINIHINSGGGSVFGGIAIYNMLRRNNAHKTVYVDGLAASIASVIMMAGDEIVMPKNATVMIHKPSASYFFTTKNADDLRKDAESLDTCQEAIMQTYMTKAKVDKEEIEQKVNDETWLTGEEAAELFDIKVEEANDAVACAGSSMFFCYKNVPTSLTAQGKNAKKKDEQRPLSRQDIKEIFNESFSEYQAREKEKKELLESLNQYGERKQNG
jgi:ATP-dependent protease ClpP protease subunit